MNEQIVMNKDEKTEPSEHDGKVSRVRLIVDRKVKGRWVYNARLADKKLTTWILDTLEQNSVPHPNDANAPKEPNDG